jgi:hypothetical protein
MAVHFKEMTGIDPLAINQTVMTEHGAPEFEHPVYRWAAARSLVGLTEEAVLFRNPGGRPPRSCCRREGS